LLYVPREHEGETRGVSGDKAQQNYAMIFWGGHFVVESIRISAKETTARNKARDSRPDTRMWIGGSAENKESADNRGAGP